ncbi:MAG: hypothetical protein N4A59_01105 [Marinifilum sp.]|nr:hypothetical protein [Marinifilum sp.]
MTIACLVFVLGSVLNLKMNNADNNVTESLESKAMAFDPIAECETWCRPYHGIACELITNYGFPIVCIHFVSPYPGSVYAR